MGVDFQDVVQAGKARWDCEDDEEREVLSFIPKKGGKADVEYKFKGKIYRQDLMFFAQRCVCTIK